MLLSKTNDTTMTNLLLACLLVTTGPAHNVTLLLRSQAGVLREA